MELFLKLVLAPTPLVQKLIDKGALLTQAMKIAGLRTEITIKEDSFFI